MKTYERLRAQPTLLLKTTAIATLVALLPASFNVVAQVATLEQPLQDLSTSLLLRPTDATLAGELVARADLGNGHTVEFYDVEGTPVIREVGLASNFKDAVKFEELRALTPLERFQAISSVAKVPQALKSAQMRWSTRPTVDEGDTEDVRPLDGQPAAGGSQKARIAAPLAASYSIDPQADAAWWLQTFCPSYDVDSAWCPTNMSWAHSGWRKTMYYDTSCMNTALTGTATCWLEHYNTSTGLWDRWGTATLNPRSWQRWWVETQGWTRSGIDGTGIHFTERFRNSPPVLTSLGNWPSNDAHYWTEELQGITHDSSNWYLASRTNIMRFALTDDLHNYPNLYYANPWASEWKHMGSPTYANGKVYVPLEKDGGSATRAAIGVFNTALNYYGTGTLPYPPSGIPDEQGANSCPWVAYNPRDGLFYSSGFNPGWLYVYNIQGTTVNYARAVRIADGNGNPIRLTHVQGGAFSDSGKLYLITHDPAYILSVDPYNGRVQSSTWTEEHPGYYEEMEGITVLDSTGKGYPGIKGQIHVLLLDNDAGQDDWYFKHYSANGPF
jgi:hypothetical protein